MKRYVLSFLFCVIVIGMMAQNDSLKKVNVYVYTPILVKNDVMDSVTFSAMKETVMKRVNKCQKTQVCADANQCEYFLSTILKDYEEKYYSAAELKSLEPDYVVSFKIRLALFYLPLENRTDTIRVTADDLVGNTDFVEKNGRSHEGYRTAISYACDHHPEFFYVNSLLEDALSVGGRIVELGTDAKGKQVVYVNKGSKDGISDNQWFDVYRQAADGTLGEMVGTLELIKREENRSQCKMHKHKQEMIQLINQGETLLVVSRESSNILKKGKRTLDGIHAIMSTVSEGVGKIAGDLNEGMDEIERVKRR